MKTTKERIHLCPICNCVEMEYMERIESEKWFRMRRFKCPVCDLVEMYTCEGPDDIKRLEKIQDAIKEEKFVQYEKRHNLFTHNNYNFIC